MNTKLVPILDYRPVHWPRPWSEGCEFAPAGGLVERCPTGVAEIESHATDTSTTSEADAATSLADTIPLISLS